ncbi:MAG: chromosome segregation protein SMC [Bacillota bacterium]
MYLKQLEIHGFKSFAEKIELNFADAINAVVGPNGSGKSNISDAIRWVLGEQSAKTLRGSKMEDIIFAGSEQKKALGFAEVSLCIDNSDKKLPVDFSEINVMRRIYRSGESEYYINKTHCRLKDIYELFMDTGIGKDGYSIIGQGRIDEILSNKSEDRRLVFEEAAGIVKYKTRKQEAEKKLEQTKQNIIRIKDIIEEIEGQLEPMKEQAEVAKRYRSIAEELKKIEVNLFIGSIDKFKSRLEAIKKDEESIQELIKEKQGLGAVLEERHAGMKKELTVLEHAFSEVNEKLHAKQNMNEKLEGECNLLQERINNLNENSSKLSFRKKELSSEHKSGVQSLLASRKNHEDLVKVYSDINKLVSEKLADYESKYKSMSSIEIEMENKQQKLFDYINSNSDIKSKINSAQSFIDNINRRIKQIEADIEHIEKQKSTKQEASLHTKETLEDIDDRINECENVIEGLKHKKEYCEKAIKDLEGKISSVKSSKDSAGSRLKVLEEMEKEHGGYSKPVKTLMHEASNLVSGFYGAVGEVIKVPSEYVTAIEIALGASVQSIITENENDAKELIEYLKKNNLGRATFLPITSVKPRRFNDNEKAGFKVDGFVGIASELIQYDKKLSNIMHSLLGRTAVVKYMDTAIKLARASNYEYKIVTLSGEVINAGGSMTGGSMNNVITSVLSRKNEIEQLRKQYDKLKHDYEELSAKLDEARNFLADYDLGISEKTSKSHKLQIDHNNCKNKYDNLLAEIQALDERINKSRKEISDLGEECKQSYEAIGEYSKQAEQLDNERSALEDEISGLQSEIKQLKDTKEAYNNEITDLKVKMAAIEENKKSLEQTVFDLEEKLAKLDQEIRQSDEELEKSSQQAAMLSEQLENKKLEVVSIKSEIEGLKAELDKKNAEKETLHADMEELEEKQKANNRDIADLQNSLHKIEMQHAKIEVELENIETKLLETYDMNYYKALSYKDDSINMGWASRRCEELKGEIREMGVVNVNAIEEYERISQRYTFLNTQVEDLTKARDSLIEVIEEICETMKQQFLTEFHKINENFTEVFAKLFGGGHAQLILADEDNILESGIEIIAKPPGKKLQNLMLLSGGERALTAIALLFAILKMKPAPFCVLDEIDAALDDANVDRYAKFLKEFSLTTQFIIVTHRKGTMEVADCLYGVSMEESGVSKLISVKLEDKVS